MSAVTSLRPANGGRRRDQDEQGAIAVVVAIAALMLFGFAALVVDLGNGFVRVQDVQSQADFAALAAAAQLPGTKTSSDPAVVAVSSYLNKNQPNDDDAGTCVAAKSCVTAAMLVNGSDADGEVYFTAGGSQLRVVTPGSTVSFGLAAAIGADSAEVQAHATVKVGSPDGMGVLPMYVATPSGGDLGCDYGLQTLIDPPGGHLVPATVPPLFADSDTNANTLTDMDAYDNNVLVSSIAVNSTTGKVTIKGSFKNVTQVGFFRSDRPSAPVVLTKTSPEWVGPPLPTALPYTQNNGSITVKVPTSVTAADILWYVRVFQDAAAGGSGAGKWSDKASAQPLSIGDAPFECAGGSSSGNFGTIKIPRSTADNSTGDGWIARNIALGTEAPLTMKVHPGTPPPSLCTTEPQPPAVVSTATSRKPGTNCVDTDTGMTPTTATPGFITGFGTSYKGLLDTGSSSPDPDGSGGCSRAGNTNAASVGGKNLNDDLLTCYLTDTTTTLSAVTRRSYSGGVKFYPAIYKSPRFGWVPVFGQEPASGGSDKYSVIDFRPMFITDQPMTATKATNAYNTGTNNGLGTTGSGSGFKLETIKVIFLSIGALPQGEGDTPIGPYLGVGPKTKRLID